jgi:hypothetical protein
MKLERVKNVISGSVHILCNMDFIHMYPNFDAPRTTEGHVINSIFKPFVTRLTASLKFLKPSDNVTRVNSNIFLKFCKREVVIVL